MSRLRARTWTQRERFVMKMSGFFGERYICIGLNEHRERIIRTKGIDLNSAYHRACADVEKNVDPVSGLSCRELVELMNELNGKRTRDRNTRWLAWRGRIELSRYANRKYPLKRHAPVSRVQISAHEDWFLMERWVPSENPNIFVKVRPLPPTTATITKTEIRPADAPEGTPWEVLA